MPRAKLQPGEDTISSAKARKKGNIYRIQWKLRLWDGRLYSGDTTGPSITIARQRARAKAREKLAGGSTASWTRGSDALTYLNAVTTLQIDSAAIAQSTKRVYGNAVKAVTPYLKGYSIDALTKPRTLEKIFSDLSHKHGYRAASSAKTVLNRYFFDELVKDTVLDYNPIKAAHINIPRVIVRPNAAGRGGNALREEEYTRVLEYLLSLDVHYLATELHWIETKLHYAVKLTLLQMVTGLRVSEACRLVWDDVVTTKDNYHGCVVHAAESKTHKGRTAIFFDERVYDYLLAHKTSSAHVIAGDDGAPSTANRQLWVKRLYNHLAETLNVPLLYKVRTHVWRTTLNTLYLDVIPDAVRAAQFGHTTAVNENSYTDTSDLSVLYRGIARKNKNLIP